MGAVVPGPWRNSTTETDLEELTKRIERLERDLRRAIDIANKAVRGAHGCAERAYRRGFRHGFDQAFEAATGSSKSFPDKTTAEMSSDTAEPSADVDAEKPAGIRPTAGLLGWLRRKHSAAAL